MKVHLHYHESLNMGDALNRVIINELFGTFVKLGNPPDSEMIAIGSILDRYIDGFPQYNWLWEHSESSDYKDKLLHVWGAGLIEESQYNEQLRLRRPMQFRALRGEYTRTFMEKVVGKKIDCYLADPGLLASKLIEPQKKKYDLGIIPHYIEFDGFAFREIHKSYPNSIIIDIEGEPIEVLKQISQCHYIVSSALHGLIASDSLGVPNLWCKFSDKVIGDGFKFRDYYSSYNLPTPCFDISGGDIPSINDIINSHKITREMVEEKQEELIRAFPFDYFLNTERQEFFSEIRKMNREFQLLKKEDSKIILEQKNEIEDLQKLKKEDSKVILEQKNEIKDLENELAQLKQKLVSMKSTLVGISQERDVAQKRIIDIENSTSWKVSKPIRLLGDLRVKGKKKCNPEIKVSIILPVYNVEPYLPRCLDALIHQTLKDIEIIAVDDCSPDGSCEILEKYAKKDKRIIIVTNKVNLKLAGARNAGLAVAKGEYISFIDSDDYIDTDFYEKLYDLAKKEDADIAKGVRRDLPENKIINNNKQIRENKWNYRFSMWTGIFRHSLLKKHDIKFVVDTICFQIKVVYFANKIVTRDDTFYNYCRRIDSNDSPFFSIDKWQSLNIRGADLVFDFINSVDIEELDYLMLVKELIIPLYFYGYNKLTDTEKAVGTDILSRTLDKFYSRAKYKEKLLSEYIERKELLAKIGKEYIAIATYSNEFTTNIGDAIQENAIHDAIESLFPHRKITKIPRDSWYHTTFQALNVMQGWFGKKHQIPNPEQKTLWIGTHFAGELREHMIKHPLQNVDFGARDVATCEIIPDAYLSRCYTLTLPRRTSSPKSGRVFLTMIPPEMEEFIPSELTKDCIRVTHHYKGEDMSSGARDLIARYKEEASIVITGKVHCATPCTALGIPVVAIAEGDEGMRWMNILEGIIPIWTRQDLYDGVIDWNPTVPDVEELKKLMLKNLELSILAAEGNLSEHSELENIRYKIKNFCSVN